MTPPSQGPDKVVLLIVAAAFALLSTWLGGPSAKSPDVKPAGSAAPPRAGA